MPVNVLFLQIEPTNLCNLRCSMCSRTSLSRFGAMPLDGLRHIVEQTPQLRAVKLQGLGEPMLAPEILPMMRYLKSRSTRVYTAMNGTVLPEDIDEFLGSVDRIEYSIDSLDSETYQRIRGGGDLRTTMKNLEILCHNKKYYPGVMISINCVLSCDTNVEEFFGLAERLGIDAINFNIQQNWSVESPSACENSIDLEKLESAIEDLSSSHGVRGMLHRPVAGYSECKWARIGCYITWDGFVTPCCQRPNPDEINFGNVFEQDLASIIASPRYAEFRNCLIGNNPPDECRSCSVYISEKAANGHSVSRKS